MNKLYLQFTEFFDKHQWKHHQFGDQPVLHTHVHGEQGRLLGWASPWNSLGLARPPNHACFSADFRTELMVETLVLLDAALCRPCSRLAQPLHQFHRPYDGCV